MLEPWNYNNQWGKMFANLVDLYKIWLSYDAGIVFKAKIGT